GWCDFVERDPAACAVIRHNLSVTHLAERATVHRMPVERAPAALQGPYTLILLDPPFDDPGALVLLQELVRSSLADPDTIIAIEHSRRQEAPGSLLPGPPGPGLPRRGIALPVWAAFTAVARRRYGDSCLTIYGQESPSNTQEGEEHAESREQAGQGVK
ncbi:MAG TPA: RsmD family RNA methyltransferase, partial [Dehalococcoidia bacterium]|nr:RsmD family RNA methyltransferase [Dehalococcoidia bacterium]